MPSLPQPGAEWAGYRVDEQIGTGGRGQVFVAFDPLLRKPVAIKILLDTPSDDPAGERFCKLPLMASGLGHRNIIRAHAASDVDGVGFVVMDWYRQGSLADEIAVSTLKLSRVRDVLAQVAAALDDAHRAEIGHLNVKPTNILRAEEGNRVVLTDFGSTRFADEARSNRPVPDHQWARLPFYEAPEVLLGEPASPAADVYSLGAVLYAALCGRVPYAGGIPRVVTEQHLAAPVPRITDQRDDLPDAFDALIAAAMAKAPAKRPGSGRSFIAGLDEAIAAPRPAPRPSRAHPIADPSFAADSPSEGQADPAAARSFRVSLREEEPEPVIATTIAASTGPRDADGAGAGDPPDGSSPPGQEAEDGAGPRPGVPDLPEESSTYGGVRRAKRERPEWELDDGTIDGGVLGVYEDEPRNRVLTAIVIGVLVVAVALVSWLVWQAVRADSDTGIDAEAVSMVEVRSPAVDRGAPTAPWLST